MGAGHGHAAAAATLDRLALGRSAVHALDSRAKALAALAVIVAVVRLPPEGAPRLLALAAPAALAAAVGGVPARFLLTRALATLPFFAFFLLAAPFQRAPAEALAAGGLLLAKALLSVATVTALVATTPFHRLLDGLERLGLPRALALVLRMLHRYAFVVRDEALALRRARDARQGGRSTLALSLAAGAGILGVLFLRTLERAERIEAAMAARGFTGEIRLLGRPAFGTRDAAVLAAVLAFVLAVSMA